MTYYWVAWWTNTNKNITQTTIARTPQQLHMVEFLEHVQKNPPPNFPIDNSTMVRIGRIADEQEGERLYDIPEDQQGSQIYDLFGTNKLVDQARAQMLVNPSPQQFAAIKRMSQGGMFDQLDALLASQRKGKK